MAGEQEQRRVVIVRQEKGKKGKEINVPNSTKLKGTVVGVEGTIVRIKIDQKATKKEEERTKRINEVFEEEYGDKAAPKRTHHSRAFRRYYRG